MKKIILILAVLALLLISGCAKSVCKTPYFEFKKGDCCLDKNSNSICDADEKEEIAKQEVKDNQLQTLDDAKKAINEGKDVSLGNITGALTKKSCWLNSYHPLPPDPYDGSPRGESRWDNMGTPCIMIEDCKIVIESLAKSSGDKSEINITQWEKYGVVKCSEKMPVDE